MKNFYVAADKKTPEIILITHGELVVTGNSLPEDARGFYVPVFKWIDEFKSTNPSKINMTLDLEYINSSSVRIILDILKMLKDTVSEKEYFKVNWKYETEDIDMMDQGKMLEKTLGHPFVFIEK